MKKIALTFVIGGLVLTSCKKDDPVEPTPAPPASTQKTLDLSISGLEDLGANYVYEGWVIVNGMPETTGTFTVDANGDLSQTSFNVTDDQAMNASNFVLTIEPAMDTDPAPSDVHILGGTIANNASTLSVGDVTALNNDFTASMGSYILATPTDGMNNNELSGVWFLDPTGPAESLTLPTLPAGWEYEGWAVINGTPVSTGKFTSTSGMDDAAPFSGTMGGPAFPGEDFVENAPSGLTFPTDLSGSTIVISVEPIPDNSAAPFLLKPLVGTTPASAASGTSYTMGQNLGSLPTGSVSIQ